MEALPPIIDIPDEIKLPIVTYLDVASRSRLSQTCHVMHGICQDKVLWEDALKKNYKFDFYIHQEREMRIKPIRRKCAFRFEWRKKHGLMLEKPRLRSIGQETVIAYQARSSRELHEQPLSVQKLVDKGILNSEDLQFLSTEEWKIINNKNIFHWINNGLITLDDALNLSYAEICKLSSHWIHQLLLGGYLDLQQAINLDVRSYTVLNNKKICEIIQNTIYSPMAIIRLNDSEIKRVQMDHIHVLICRGVLPISTIRLEALDDIMLVKLNKKGICQLLCNKKITINDVTKLSEYGLSILESEWICQLICDGKIRLENAVNRAFKPIMQRLDSQWVCRLIADEILSIDEAEGLHPDSFRNLDSEWIYKLIRRQHWRDKLSLQEAKSLNKQQFNNLNSVRVYQLIEAGKMTVQEACELSEAESANVNSEWIYKLITHKYITFSVSEAKKLPYSDASDIKQNFRENLDSEWIFSLIKHGPLRLEDAKTLTRNQIKRLNYQWMAALICKRKLTIADAQRLSEEEIQILNKEWMYKLICPKESSYGIFDVGFIKYLIKNREIWIESQWICELVAGDRTRESLKLAGAKELTKLEIERLGNKWICKLIGWTYSYSKAKFTIEEAKALTDAELSRLGNKFVCGLLCKKKLTLEDARKLTDKELARLSDRSICKLICKGEADLRSILVLPDDAFADLVVFASGRMKAQAEGRERAGSKGG